MPRQDPHNDPEGPTRPTWPPPAPAPPRWRIPTPLPLQWDDLLAGTDLDAPDGALADLPGSPGADPGPEPPAGTGPGAGPGPPGDAGPYPRPYPASRRRAPATPLRPSQRRTTWPDGVPPTPPLPPPQPPRGLRRAARPAIAAVAAAALLALTARALPHAQPSPPPPPLIPVVIQQRAYSFQLNPGWHDRTPQPTPGQPAPLTVLTRQLGGTFDANLTLLRATPHAPTEPLPQLPRAVATHLDPRLHAHPTGAPAAADLDGEPAITYDLTLDYAGQPLRSRQLACYHHGDLYILTLTSTPATFTDHAKDLNQAIITWQWH